MSWEVRSPQTTPKLHIRSPRLTSHQPLSAFANVTDRSIRNKMSATSVLPRSLRQRPHVRIVNGQLSLVRTKSVGVTKFCMVFAKIALRQDHILTYRKRDGPLKTVRGGKGFFSLKYREAFTGGVGALQRWEEGRNIALIVILA